MHRAIIGFTGFVGTTLKRQTVFEFFYNSKNISSIDGTSLETIICAAAPAQKWIANREPLADRQNIHGLIEHLKTVTCNTFILISTVDVFCNANKVNEDTLITQEGLNPYGLHRRELEEFVEANFANYLIVRLPGIVGPGLRKNVIFDFLNTNNLHAIDSRGVFQFYPIINLWYDIQIALKAELKLVHLTAEPISVLEVAETCFGKDFDQVLSTTPATYDFQSKYAALFGGKGMYQYSKRETIQAIRAYAQTEPITIENTSGGNL